MSIELPVIEVPQNTRDLSVAGRGFTSRITILDGRHVIKEPNRGEHGKAEIERKIYQRLGAHPRITPVIGYHEKGIIMERLSCAVRQRLLEFKAKNRRPTTDQILRWSTQATEAVQYIHSQGVMQIDIKTENMLLDQYDDLKLVDFAGSSIDGSVGAIAPAERETMPGHSWDQPPITITELFSLGSVMYEIENGEQMWPHIYPQMREIEKRFKFGFFPDTKGFILGDIIQNCWHTKYKDAGELLVDLNRLRHELLTKYDYELLPEGSWSRRGSKDDNGPPTIMK